MTAQVIPEEMWRSFKLTVLAEARTIDIPVPWTERMADELEIEVLGDLVDYLSESDEEDVAFAEFDGELGEPSEIQTAVYEALTRYSQNGLENFPYPPFSGNGEEVAEQEEAEAEPQQPDPAPEPQVAPPPPEASKGGGRVDWKKQAGAEKEAKERLINWKALIREKRRDVRKAKAELDLAKENARNARKRFDKVAEELFEMIDESEDDQMRLPGLSTADAEAAKSERTQPRAPDKKKRKKTGKIKDAPAQPKPEPADSQPAAAQPVDDWEEAAEDTGGWTSENWNNAPVTVIGLTEKQLETLKDMKVDLMGDLSAKIDAGERGIGKRIINKFDAWMDQMAASGDQTEETEDSDEAQETQCEVHPGRPKLIKLTVDIPGFDSMDQAMFEGRACEVVRWMGERPIVETNAPHEMACLEPNQYEVLEVWEEE